MTAASEGCERPRPSHCQAGALVLPATDGVATLREALRALDTAAITPTDVGLHKPTFDDVFLTLTRSDHTAGHGQHVAAVAGTGAHEGSETS